MCVFFNLFNDFFFRFIQKKRNILSHKKLHNLFFVKFNAKIKNKISSINRDPLAAIDDEKRVTDWLVPPKTNGAPASESDDEVFPEEGLI